MKKMMAGSFLAGGVLFSMVVCAERESFVVREHNFDMSDVEHVRFEADVGSINVMPVEGTEMRVVLEIEGGGRWFRRDKDVSDVDLRSYRQGDTLVLEVDEKDTKTDWYVELPAVAATRISLGVGEVAGEFGDTELSVDLGVGDVDISAPVITVGEVHLSVGVGDAVLRGGQVVREERAVVAREVWGSGEGEHDATVDLGVGDITLNLQ